MRNRPTRSSIPVGPHPASAWSIIYKSFGKNVPQAEIWPLIAKPNRFGSIASTTHLMALHAIGQGLSAVIIQARHPLQVLRLCREAGVRAILNQRPHSGVSTAIKRVRATCGHKQHGVPVLPDACYLTGGPVRLAPRTNHRIRRSQVRDRMSH